MRTWIDGHLLIISVFTWNNSVDDFTKQFIQNVYEGDSYKNLQLAIISDSELHTLMYGKLDQELVVLEVVLTQLLTIQI